MQYIYSQHYRENPFEEVEAALAANHMESVQATYEARLKNEQRHTPPDTESIERINSQLTYLGSIALQDAQVA